MNSTRPRVLVRADAGSGVGFGHVVRCLTLAEQLIRRGAEVTIATRSPGDDVIARVRAVGARLHDMQVDHDAPQPGSPRVLSVAAQRADAREALGLSGEQWDAVVVDHYRLDVEWEEEVRPSTRRLVVVDDLADRRHSADVLVDHNWYGHGTADRYRGLVAEETLQLLGPRYCLLDSAYAVKRSTRDRVNRPPQSVLVNFGGTDAADQTLLAASAVLEATDLRIEVAVGSQSVVSDELTELARAESRVTLHVAVPNLAELLGKVDLVIGASGTGTWERLCMGVPSIVTTVSESQSGVTRELSRADACVWLGVASQVSAADYVDALRRAAAGDLPEPPTIVDGHGSARVALAILGARCQDAVSRAANASDDASFVTLLAGADPDSGAEEWRGLRAEFDRLRASDDEVDILHIDEVPIGVELRLRSGGVQRLVDTCIDGRET